MNRLSFTPNLDRKCRDFVERHGIALLPGENRGLGELVPPLVQVLTAGESEELSLSEAAYYLGLIGAPAEPAVAPLAALIARNPITPTANEVRFELSRDMPWCCCGFATLAAMDALKRISPERAIEDIATLCRDPDTQVRFRAVRTLERIGEPSQRIIPLLLELLRDRDGRMRGFALVALWPYQTLDKETLNAVSALASDGDMIVRLRVDYLLANNLPEYQRRFADGIIQLVDRMHDADDGVEMVQDICFTIPMMGSDAARFVDRTMERIRSESPVTVPVLALIDTALRQIVGHYPALTKKIRASLQTLATPDNETARRVLSAWSFWFRRVAL